MGWKRMVVASAIAALAATGTVGAQNGNGGFNAGPVGAGYFGFQGNDEVWADITIQCSSGFTCGLTNLEVDWDDGSAIDSYVNYLPIFDEEFTHEYQANGAYHVFLSADDDNGNWWNTTRDLEVTGH